MSNKTTESFVISGTAHWAKVHKPTQDDKGIDQYTIDLSIDSATKKTLEALNISVKNAVTGVGVKEKKPDDTRGDFVSLKTSIKPKVVDSKKQAIPETTLIGNGSKVKVKTHVYDWKFKNRSGSSLGLDAVQVLDLVEYTTSGLDIFEEEDGFDTSTITVSDGSIESRDVDSDEEAF